jgi:hypothetical protein
MVWFEVFNITFNNISVISWQSVLLGEETGVPGEKYRPVASHLQTTPFMHYNYSDMWYIILDSLSLMYRRMSK